MSDSSVSPSELKRQHPDEKRQSDFQNHFWAFLVVRPLSFYVAPLFLRFGLGANHVTAIGAVVLCVGLVSIATGTSFTALAFGAVLLNLWYLLDFVDGVVARYNETSSAFGAFLDWFVGVIYHVATPFVVAVALYRTDAFAFLEVSAILWFGVATVEVVFRLVRWLVLYKTTQLLPATDEEPSTDLEITPGMLAGVVSSFKAPLLFLGVVLGAIDLWLLLYAAYTVAIFGPELLIHARRLSRYDRSR
ncbi:CDP-alcohol phosphatidyltransferase family protein [Natrarchaeobius oligotrophus]|uniref:CDP-alcohol phosphatidyltransferase family protein n=1 Tax=Natrarchaeobius chitinivorans TaxID=1679083 RepID=A0A3N6MDL3_NATCH|nr:CDP-alcohol phosphatidyltransferase family protein [Natrarchaeobius chitinivorans]RQH01959.1 CDP-alcohol phosphatidyltransferase family protein [Natrarchaeobius chitinivorans]